MWGTNGAAAINYRGAGAIDVFDGAYTTFANAMFANDLIFKSYAASPWVIGIMGDDTDFVAGMGATPDFDSVPSGVHKVDIGYVAVVTSPAQTYSNFTYSS